MAWQRAFIQQIGQEIEPLTVPCSLELAHTFPFNQGHNAGEQILLFVKDSRGPCEGRDGIAWQPAHKVVRAMPIIAKLTPVLAPGDPSPQGGTWAMKLH